MQNGLAESAINSIMRLACTVMAESGLGGRFWFKAAAAGVDAHNATYKHLLGETPCSQMYCEPKDVSLFRAFQCRVFMHLNSDRRDKGKHTPHSLMEVYLEFEPNTSSWSFFIPEKNMVWSMNQAQFDEHSFPFLKISLTSSVRTAQLMSCIKPHLRSSGFLTISLMSANIQGCTTIRQLT